MPQDVVDRFSVPLAGTTIGGYNAVTVKTLGQKVVVDSNSGEGSYDGAAQSCAGEPWHFGVGVAMVKVEKAL